MPGAKMMKKNRCKSNVQSVIFGKQTRGVDFFFQQNVRNFVVPN